MATPNTLSAYELLRRVMEQQRAQQQGGDWNSPSLVPEQNPDGDQAPQGLLGRLRALQAEQSQYQPVAGVGEAAAAQSRDPNFRQLSRVSLPIQGESAAGASNWLDNRSSSSLAPVETGVSADKRGNMGRGPAEAEAQNNRPTPVAAGFSQMIRPFPVPPMGPVPFPPIPRPKLSDWWDKLWEALQVYPTIRYGGVRRRGNNNEDCDERYGKETSRCYERIDEYAHPDFLHGCKQRAKDRRNLCVANGGRPNLEEPREWGLADEEVYRNYGR